MYKVNYTAFNWVVDDVELQLQGIVDTLGKDIPLTEEEKEDILDEAIKLCEDDIIYIINNTIQSLIFDRIADLYGKEDSNGEGN